MVKILSGHLCLISLLLITGGCAMGDPAGPATITGTVRLVGNAPFARLVLTPADGGREGRGGDYLLIGPLQEELRRVYQGVRVTLEGSPCASPDPRFPSCFEAAKIVGMAK